jgi:predicted Holliday junction resolvase-like endonuclease
MESKMKEQTAVEWLEEQFEESYSYINEIFKETIDQAKEMEKEQLEKELNAFFLYFRNNGEHFIGMPIEQFVKKYLKNR